MSIQAAWLSGDARVADWLGGPPPTATGIAAIPATGLVAVVCGQQPALGGGPLYTLVKAVTACAIARTLRQRGVDAQAWYWCASEDHDLGEAGHADLIARDGRIHRIAHGLGGGRAALRHRPARDGWDALVAGLRGLGPGLGSDWLLAHAPKPDEPWGVWQCRLVSGLLPEITAVEGHTLRSRWAERIARTWSAWPAAQLAQRRADIAAAGFAPTFADLPAPPWFHDRSDAREAVAAPAAIPAGDLSPGAALRPVLQQLALPCAVFVAGPGEIAYHAEIGPVYAALDAPRPILWPRPQVTLVPGWVSRGAQAHGMTVDQVIAGEVLAAPAVMTAGLRTALAALPQDAPHLRAARQRLEQVLSRLDRSVARAAAPRPALGVLQTYLRPRTQPQDRVLTLAQAVWQHGPGLGRVLVQAVEGAQAGAALILPV